MSLAFPSIEISLGLVEPIDLWGGWGGLVRKVAWGRGRRALAPHPRLALLEAERFTALIGLDQLASHVSDQNGRVMLQFPDRFQKSIFRKKATLFFARIADARDNTQEVQPNSGFVVM